MTLDEITAAGIDPALALLPKGMDSKEARTMLLAIGLQESNFEFRQQLVGNPQKPTGPAKSFWQGELGGGMVAGVRTHKATKPYAAKLYTHFSVEPVNRAIWDAIKDNDALAAGLARLLLYSDPLRLPATSDEEGAWKLYLRTWRPGAWERGTAKQSADLRAKWKANHRKAVEYVNR